MRPLYVAEPLAAALFWTLYMAWFAFEAGNMLRLRRPPNGVSQDRGSKIALIGGVYVAVFCGFAFAFAAPAGTIVWQRHTLFYAGLVLLIGGIVLRAYAARWLGTWFTLDVMTRPGQVVVDSGPYRWVRHPAYSGSLLTVLGILSCATNWFVLACFVPVLMGYGYRIAVEENALANDLGDPYREYMRRTKRLIPFLF